VGHVCLRWCAMAHIMTQNDQDVKKSRSVHLSPYLPRVLILKAKK
jgi:hypothetical protein